MIAHMYGGPRDGVDLELPKLPAFLHVLRSDAKVIYIDDKPPPDVEVMSYRRLDPIIGDQATYHFEGLSFD